MRMIDIDFKLVVPIDAMYMTSYLHSLVT